MKRILVLIICMVFVCCMGYAVAETATAGTMVTTFDATPIAVAAIMLIAAALGALLLWITKKYITPLLEIPIIGTVAKWAVNLAEAALGSGNGDAKYAAAAEFVVKMLGKIHITVDAEQIRAAIETAWAAMNLSQIVAGIKKVADTQVEETNE